MSLQTATAITGPLEPQYVMVPIREKNGLGVAGFLISLLGLFIPTGIIAVLGLLISLVALGRAPRGLATLGVIIGLLGTVFWIVVTVAAGIGALAVGGIVLAAFTAGFILLNTEMIEVTADMTNVTIALVERQERDGTLPGNLEPLGLSLSTLTDPWGKPYRYQIVEDKADEEDELGFDLVSSGGDGAFGTEDDLAWSRIDAAWESALEGFGRKMEDLGNRVDRLQSRWNRHGQTTWAHRSEKRARDTGAVATVPPAPVPSVPEVAVSEKPRPPVAVAPPAAPPPAEPPALPDPDQEPDPAPAPAAGDPGPTPADIPAAEDEPAPASEDPAAPAGR